MEKFIVSARKYRPQTFDTVVGQQHITTTLKNAIKSGHLAHAFLFCGPRGVGKTTCARILAKTINCENQQDGEACDTCHSCQSFNEGTSMNIHELDAASNNSVEDIRSLVDQVRFAPQAGKYKVYIIDEVHMLSSSAFNAFLKTLEEPPPYAIFILATTEKHKILPTILSRCQIFDFKRITLQDTVDHLASIATKETITAEETALQLIAQKSEGCMRDALSILDKIVSFTNGAVTYHNTIEHLNILDADYYFKMMACMLEQDLAGAMLLYDDINKKGFEGDAVLNGFAEFMRNLLISKDERITPLLEVVESFKVRFAEMSKRTDTGYLVSALNILNEAEINFKSARNKRLHVELVLIKLCYLQQALQLTADGGAIDKKKTVSNSRSVAFRNIAPIAIPPSKTPAATLIVPVEKKEAEKPKALPPPPPPSQPVPTDFPDGLLVSEYEDDRYAYQPPPPPSHPPVEAPKPRKKLSSLEALRQQIDASNAGVFIIDQPLEIESLKKAWADFIVVLKNAKNPAWQSFGLAQLTVKDPNCFEATASNNLQQKFLELERNKACDYLRKELGNRILQFNIVLVENPNDQMVTDLPLSSKDQYQKLVEEFPLVKELKERLRLELDY